MPDVFGPGRQRLGPNRASGRRSLLPRRHYLFTVRQLLPESPVSPPNGTPSLLTDLPVSVPVLLLLANYVRATVAVAVPVPAAAAVVAVPAT